METASAISKATCISSIPSTFPSIQRYHLIKDIHVHVYGVTLEDVSTIVEFVGHHCPTFVGIHSKSSPPTIILAPPVSKCYDCDHQLVSNHSCNVR